jgi:hypothetical protein
MKTLHRNGLLFGAHTWKDVGGISGLLIDGCFLLFLMFVSGLMLLAGAVVVIADYLCHPIVLLLSRSHGQPQGESPPVEGTSATTTVEEG